MSYRRTLLVRWSRRDRLTAVVVAVSVAFLVGTVVLVTAAGAQTTAVAGDYAATETVVVHESPAAARAAAAPDDRVVPFAVVTVGGRERTVVAARAGDGTAAFGLDPGAGDTVTVGGVDTPRDRTLVGTDARRRVTVTPRASRGVVPDEWFVATDETVRQLGVTGAFRLRTVPEATPPRTGTPLRGALPFFLFGAREALGALSVVAGGSAVLIAVVVYSVTRMTVRDRRRTIRIVRATGGRRRDLLVTFGLRAAGIGAVGVALGYAVGVILVNAAVNLAVFLGLPVALDVSVTSRVAELVAPTLVAAVVVAGAAGVLAAWPAVRGPPLADGSATRRSGDGDAPTRRRGDGDASVRHRLGDLLTPTLLDRRALVPTAATLATFVVFVVVVAGIAGVLGPLTAGGTATVTEPDAPHPIASRVPATVADDLRDRGIDASGELLLFQASDGRPYTVRGANFSAFRTVTDARIVAGRQPRRPDEAVVGAGLARTLGLERGDAVPLGGITRQRVAVVRIVGVYAAPGPFDDQLLVPLATARHLANSPAGTVQFVRADSLPPAVDPGESRGVRVTELTAPSTVASDESFTVGVTVTNPTPAAASRRIRVAFDGQTRTVGVDLEPGATRRLNVSFVAGAADATVTAGDRSRRVAVAPASAVRFSWLPATAPPNATFQTRLSTVGGGVENVSVVVDGRAVPVAPDGRVTIPTGTPGETRIRVRNAGATTTRTVPVRRDAVRAGRLSVRIRPERPDLLTRPAATVRLTNPWNESLTRRITVENGGRRQTRAVTVNATATASTRVRLQRQSPGSHEVRVVALAGGDPTERATATYRVTGDERIAATLAAGGGRGSGIGRAVESTFGNLQLVSVTLLALAALTTVGGTTAAFAQSVHARRRAVGVYRVTGATPGGVLRLVVTDALVIGCVASLAAVVAGLAAAVAVERAGYLTVFGVRLSVTPDPALVAGCVVGALSITVVSAGLATLSLLRAEPAALLSDDTAGAHAGDGGDER